MARIGRIAGKKASRLAWSRNANAAKARKRMEGPVPEREPSRVAVALPFEITIRSLADGAEGTFRPRSGRHAKRVLDVVLAYYMPGGVSMGG